MVEPEVGGAKPILVTLGKKGDAVFWCACGRSKTQPFCDGSHAGTPFRPVRYVAARDGEEALFCACKRSRGVPFCDGSHNQLTDVYERADNGEIAASLDTPIAARSGGAFGLSRLDGASFVLTPNYLAAERRGGWRVIAAITRKVGADQLAQLILDAGVEAPRSIRFGASEVVLFVARGRGEATISGRTFPVEPECALAVRPGETFSLRSDGATPILATATICPHQDEFEIIDAATAFDERFPQRTARVDETQKQAMGDRFYQVLADDRVGAAQITQFIGEIPRSRAAAHRHLYEEAILILSGEGFIWTEKARAAVRAGDIIYLPRKQLHSLECISAGGMRLAGAFYPAGSPAINY